MTKLHRFVSVLILTLAAFAGVEEDYESAKREGSDYRLRWVEEGRLTLEAYELLTAVRSDTTFLCDKKRYGLDRIDLLMERLESDGPAKKQLNTLLSEIFLQYRHDRKYGCFDPYEIYPEHIGIFHEESNLSTEREHLFVRRLEKALRFYEVIDSQGGWSYVPGDFYMLKEGEVHHAVPAIRARLRVTGDYNGTVELNPVYDDKLAMAVINFQARHGLKPDGIVGPRTLRALNVPVTDKIEIIKINLERLRWLTDGRSDFIVANIPAYSLSLYRQNREVLTMKTVVGQRSRPTPMLSDVLTYAVLNPYWRAPKTIVEEDILPKLQAGRFDALERMGIVATKTSDGNVTVDFSSVDWRRYSAENLPYIFLQKPGPFNYLGFVKFMFPNDFDIYIHDTPHDKLFTDRNRARSSGCIRVEKPIELFHALFNPDGEGQWRYKRIISEIMKKREKLVGLPEPIPVYILYMTAYVDEKGDVHFLEDIYGYDRQMLEYISNNKHH